MSDLFTHRAATFSTDGLHRLDIRRAWDDRLPLLPVVMLNPSRASGERDDPTALSVSHFARRWGFGGWRGGNLYSLISPLPTVMMSDPGRSIPANDEALRKLIEYAATTRGQLLAAWGNDGDFEGRAMAFALKAAGRGLSLICLGRTMSGAPKHPLARGKHRIDRHQMPLPWTPA